MIYLIGSLRNPEIVRVGNLIRSVGLEVFDDWYAPGPEADEYWQRYELSRGHTYEQALRGHAARHIFEFDKEHLDRATAAVLVMPAGRSAHLELGYAIGCGKPGFVLFDEEPKRYDVMYQFCTDVFFSDAALLQAMRRIHADNSDT